MDDEDLPFEAVQFLGKDGEEDGHDGKAHHGELSEDYLPVDEHGQDRVLKLPFGVMGLVPLFVGMSTGLLQEVAINEFRVVLLLIGGVFGLGRRWW